MSYNQDCGGEKSLKMRNERIDSVKYWLIILVIAGHVFEEFKAVPECKFVWDWIYIFHMPLFIFISGYFSEKKDFVKFKQSIWKLLEPLLFYQILVQIPWIYFKGCDNYLIALFSPWWVLWYLLSLISWRLMLQVIPNNFLRKRYIMLFTTICISISAGFFPFNYFLSIQRTLAFMPFFFGGYYAKGKNLFLPERYRPFCVIFLMLTFVVPLFFSHFLGSLTHYKPYDDVYDAIKRIAVFCLSVPMSLAFVNICPNTSWIARQGRMTMQYYIYHALAITPLMAFANKLGIPSSFFTATFFTIALIIGIGIASRLPYFEKFTNPSLFFKNKPI